MAFDECPPYQPAVKKSRQRLTGLPLGAVTAHQLERSGCLALGSVYLDLRSCCCRCLAQLELDMQLAVWVWENPGTDCQNCQATAPLLPLEKKPRCQWVRIEKWHNDRIWMGCLTWFPLGCRHGAALVQGDRWNLKNAQISGRCCAALDATCPCYAENFSRAYLCRELRSREIFGLHTVEHSARIDFLYPENSGRQY